MSPRHLGCPGCRIRLFANVPEAGLLDGMCPICGTRLQLASSASGVMGFRLFDLGPLSDRGLSAPSHAVGRPVGFVGHRRPAVARDGCDTPRWLDEGGSFPSDAVAEWPAPQW